MRWTNFKGEVTGSIAVRPGESPEQAIERAQAAINSLVTSKPNALRAVVACDKQPVGQFQTGPESYSDLTTSGKPHDALLDERELIEAGDRSAQGSRSIY